MRPLTFCKEMLPAASSRSSGAGRAGCAQSTAVRMESGIKARMDSSYRVEKLQVSPARSSWVATSPARSAGRRAHRRNARLLTGEDPFPDRAVHHLHLVDRFADRVVHGDARE